jgi:hypothetical protein
MRKFGAVLFAAAASLVGLTGCRPAGVRLVFAPRPGAVYRFAVHVVSTSTTRLTGQPPRTHTDDVQLDAVDTVLATTPSASRVRVEVSHQGSFVADYVVQLDEQAALVGIEAVDGEPTARLSTDLGGLQLQDLLPAAVGAPPDRLLQAGDGWQAEQPFDVPNLAPTTLSEHGRLDHFGVTHHRRVAVTTTSGTLVVTPEQSPLPSTADGSAVRLRGTEHTTTAASRDVADGSIEASSAHTSGLFDVVLISTSGPTGAPLVTGQLTLDVRSTTTRLS